MSVTDHTDICSGYNMIFKDNLSNSLSHNLKKFLAIGYSVTWIQHRQFLVKNKVLQIRIHPDPGSSQQSVSPPLRSWPGAWLLYKNLSHAASGQTSVWKSCRTARIWRDGGCCGQYDGAGTGCRGRRTSSHTDHMSAVGRLLRRFIQVKSCDIWYLY